jgi:hypothetical protein
LFVLRGGYRHRRTGKVFHDAAEAALIHALTSTLSPAVGVVTDPAAVNDPGLATAMARALRSRKSAE